MLKWPCLYTVLEVHYSLAMLQRRSKSCISAMLRKRFQVLYIPTPKLTPIHNGINQHPRVALQPPAALDAADLLEAEPVPDPARRHIRLVDQVKDGVHVAQPRSPVDVALSQQTPHAAAAGRLGHEEAGVAHVAAAP